MDADLSRHPYLQLLTPSARAAARVLSLARGEILFRRGDTPRHACCVLQGEVQLLRYSRTGHALVVARGTGGFIAEASLEAVRYHCDAQAVTAAEVLTMPLAVYRIELDDNPAFRRARFTAQAREIRRLRARGERLALASAGERLLHYLETEGSEGRVDLDGSLKALAAELNLSHEALYRTLARLAKAGVIERGEGFLRLV